MPTKTNQMPTLNLPKDDPNVTKSDLKMFMQILDSAKPFFVKALTAHSADLPPLLSSPPLTIADFGSNYGVLSSAAMSMVVQGLRGKYGFDQTPSIVAIHDDLPGNNWTSLFEFIYNDPRSYLKTHRGTQALASGLSYYGQALASNSLHLGFSSCSLHWLSEVPTKISEHCFSMFAAKEERELFKLKAAEDWTNFLTARSAELVRGGVLVLHMISNDETVPLMFDAVYDAALKLNDDGFITDEELLNFNMKIVWRTLEDITHRQALYDSLGLELVAAEQCLPSENVYYEAYKRHNDVDLFIDEFSSVMTTLCEPAFLAALDSSSKKRTESERKEIVDMLWHEYRLLLKETPDECAYTWHNMFVVLKKK